MESKIKNGVIHTHSEHSCRDSAMSTAPVSYTHLDIFEAF